MSAQLNEEILVALGFQRGTGFLDECWTNPDSPYMVQVWVVTQGEFWETQRMYDARTNKDLQTFFEWWERETEAFYYNERQSLLHR